MRYYRSVQYKRTYIYILLLLLLFTYYTLVHSSIQHNPKRLRALNAHNDGGGRARASTSVSDLCTISLTSPELRHGRRACYPIYLNNVIILLPTAGLAFHHRPPAWCACSLPFVEISRLQIITDVVHKI